MYDLSAKEVFFNVQETRGDRRIVLKHVFRLHTFQDWVEYHRGTSQLGLSKGRDTVEVSNVAQEKDMWFWDILIIRVEHYTYQSKPLMELEDWKERIPLPHKLQAISGFLKVFRVDVPEEDALISEETLDLAADSLDMRFNVIQNSQLHDVQFFFNNPEPKDYVRFNRVSSKMQLVRTKQRGVSAIKIPTNIQPFVDLFDKLIQKVEGFSFNGKDLMKADKWKDKIDAYHKRMAIQEVFTSSLEESESKTERE